MNKVTIIPENGLVMIDGRGFDGLDMSGISPSIHAVQWYGNAGEIEYVVNSKGEKPANGAITSMDAFAAQIAAWSAAKEAADAPLPAPTLQEAKAEKLVQIDAETSQAIINGFDYAPDGETLHFSYDANDQQNFADTANAATLAMMGVPGVPTEITWNGWKVAGEGKELVRLTLAVDAFLDLYMNGALVHKATQMEIGSQRKMAVDAAKTIKGVELA